jgi:hypothetical protein
MRKSTIVQIFGVVLGLIASCSYNGVTENHLESKAAQASPTTSPAVPNNQGLPEGQQRKFHMEEEVQNPVEIPESIIELLLRVESIDSQSCSGSSEKLRECLVASRAHLGSEKFGAVFIIMGRGKLRGANVTPFWVIKDGQEGPEILLRTTALEIGIKGTGTGRVADVYSISATANHIDTTLYRYREGTYQAIQTKSEPIEFYFGKGRYLH